MGRRSWDFRCVVWYICAMGLKELARFAVILAVALTPVTIAAQLASQRSASRPGANRPVSSAPAPAVAAQRETANPTPAIAGEGAQQLVPRVTVANAPPAPAPWPLHEKIAWAANLVLAVLGYAGIMMALSLLKKIERQASYAEAAIDVAATSARAAYLNAQAVVNAERPWILITVEPSRSAENSFTIIATNRGRSPARITATAEQAIIAVDERYLPFTPEYDREESKTPLVPIILVPGESTPIKPFSREEVKALCDSEERFRRIETWEEKLYLYGKVVYLDLISTPENQAHESNWCCWYIHGRQNSGLVLAGPPAYNAHT